MSVRITGESSSTVVDTKLGYRARARPYYMFLRDEIIKHHSADLSEGELSALRSLQPQVILERQAKTLNRLCARLNITLDKPFVSSARYFQLTNIKRKEMRNSARKEAVASLNAVQAARPLKPPKVNT